MAELDRLDRLVFVELENLLHLQRHATALCSLGPGASEKIVEYLSDAFFPYAGQEKEDQIARMSAAVQEMQKLDYTISGTAGGAKLTIKDKPSE